MAKVSFIDKETLRIEAQNGDILMMSFCDVTNYVINEETNGEFLDFVSDVFDKYYDGTNESIWGDIIRLFYKNKLVSFRYVTKSLELMERARIGQRIKDLRKQKNKTAKMLASSVGIDAGNLSKIEQGRYSVGLDILTKIANELDMKIDFVEK